jgi:hypothetical protein
VRDLHGAAARFEEAYGLTSTAGGIHPRWGTANRIIALGQARYGELIAVVDPDVAANDVLGRAIADRTATGDRWFAVCLGDDDIDATARRLGLVVEPGARTLPDGREVGWRGAGIDDPRRTPDLPFFIAWTGEPDAHPGARGAAHPSGAIDIAWVEIAGDADRFRAWTGDAALPVRFVNGAEGVVAVGLCAPDGDVVIR